ncbi:unnamed protein product [Fraxinus pennsylvanica]|uniref:Uncharacterized protein n=1 Tax=Fraxinus pennsylvanica TaxID=56036 RepID=A0AAD2ABY4_9LAMI|nr:unnamed protein product [Fraxinus pennsylvanica]
MADLAFLPKFFSCRSIWFKPPWVGILLSIVVALGVSYMSYIDIISSADFLYSLGMLLEFASFLWLRRKFPTMKRPYRVPLKQPTVVLMCLIPTAFLVVIMAIATSKLFHNEMPVETDDKDEWWWMWKKAATGFNVSPPQSELAQGRNNAKMVKGRQGERVRLYVRGTILGYKRSKSNQYPNTSLIQIEGVNSKEEVAWYQVASSGLSSSPTSHRSPWAPAFASSCTLATFEVRSEIA